MGVPNSWMVYVMENPIRIDDLGGYPQFWETPMWGHTGIQDQYRFHRCPSPATLLIHLGWPSLHVWQMINGFEIELSSWLILVDFWKSRNSISNVTAGSVFLHGSFMISVCKYFDEAISLMERITWYLKVAAKTSSSSDYERASLLRAASTGKP